MPGTKFNSVLLSFEGFGKLDLSKPIRLLPEGKWFRDSRELDITQERLLEMVRNFKNSLPNFRVGFNLDHEDTGGKVGDIKDVAYLPGGPQGSGLYATEYELTEKGQKAIDEDGYDGVSCEVVWTLNGSMYQDPVTGAEHDNVLVGVALTPYPFFGHGELALYKTERGEVERCYLTEAEGEYHPYGGAQSFEEYEAWQEAAESAQELRETTYVFQSLMDNILADGELAPQQKMAGLKTLTSEFEERFCAGSPKRDDEEGWVLIESEDFREFSPEERKKLAKSGKAMPDGSYPIVTVGDLQNAISAIGRAKNRAATIKHIKKRARALGKTGLLPEEWSVIMSLWKRIKDAFSPEVTAEIKAEIEAGEIDPAEAVEELGDKIALELLGIEKLAVEPVVGETVEEVVVEESTPTVETLAVELSASKSEIDTLKAQIEADRLGQRQGELKAEAEAFKALPIKVDEYVDKMTAIGAVNGELATWLHEKFAAMDTALVEAGLLREIGSEREGDLSEGDAFLQMVKNTVVEKFDGDMSKYGDALALVAKAHPELAAAYIS